MSEAVSDSLFDLLDGCLWLQMRSVRYELGSENLSVLAHPKKQRRRTSPLEVYSDEVKAGHYRTRTIVLDGKTHVIESFREPHPSSIVRTEA